MARFTKDLVLNKPDEFVQFMMNDYLQKNQFSMSTWKKKEQAYRAGDAMMEGYKYLQWSYANGVLHIEAWLRGTFGGEWNLDGFVGCAMKKPYKSSLEQLFELLQQEIPQGQQIQNGQQVVQVQTVNNTKAANVALVMGILSIVFCWIPIASIILSCLGFSRARMGAGSSDGKLANAGKVCCIIGFVFSCVLWACNFLLLYY